MKTKRMQSYEKQVIHPIFEMLCNDDTLDGLNGRSALTFPAHFVTFTLN